MWTWMPIPGDDRSEREAASIPIFSDVAPRFMGGTHHISIATCSPNLPSLAEDGQVGHEEIGEYQKTCDH